MELEHSSHSVFLMYYHLVLVVKYRRKVFDDEVSVRAKEIFDYIAPKYHISLQEWNHDKDHVHILFRAYPNSELSRFINVYKSASKKRNFLEYARNYGKNIFGAEVFVC